MAIADKMDDDASKPRRGRPRTMDAAKLRDVAMAACWHGDPAEVSVNAIGQMAGVSKPSLYRAFGNEDRLTRAVLDGYAEQVLSAVLAILHAGRGLRDTLAALVDVACADPPMETGCLFFPGDILTVYAVTGSVLYLFRDWPVRRLVRVGAALLAVQAIIAAPLLLAAPETPPDIVATERAILAGGGFLGAVMFRSIGFAIILLSFLVIQGISALGWFCLGLAAVKSGMNDDAGHPLWRRARRWCLVPGVAQSLAGAAIWQRGPSSPGIALGVVSAPVATLGYLGQSILLSTVFSGYGLGLWGAVDRMTAVLGALAATAGLIGALMLWRRAFRLGPFEWLLRRFTYARLERRQPHDRFPGRRGHALRAAETAVSPRVQPRCAVPCGMVASLGRNAAPHSACRKQVRRAVSSMSRAVSSPSGVSRKTVVSTGAAAWVSGRVAKRIDWTIL